MMSNLSETLAQQAVAAFRAELGGPLIEQIGEHQLERLHLLVAEAVSAALSSAAERVDELARALRSEGESGSLDIEL
jgi:hypothetical protein